MMTLSPGARLLLNNKANTMTVYGIPNCNTVKKATSWLKENGLEFTFHDFKKNGISEEKLNAWCDAFGWENVLNKKGTTWRKLSPDVQAAVVDQSTAVDLMRNHTSAIKRPLIEQQNRPVLIGFQEGSYARMLNSSIQQR
jgi:arsenate reductase